MPSKAHAALSHRLKDVDQLMDAHSKVGGDQPGRRYALEALNRASILLLSAHLEGYLEDLMAEAILAVNGHLVADRVISTFSNPSIGNIDRLFAFLGLEKPSGKVKWSNAGNEAVKRNINLLVGARNQIAHGATDVRVTKVQVMRYRGYVVGFAKAFDRIVHDRVVVLTGNAPWPA